jgi:hypothetical protein
MKKYKILAFLLPLFVFSNCDLSILEDPNGIKPENGNPLYFIAGAFKLGFEGHNQICWSAGLIGGEEISAISANISQTPVFIETEKTVRGDLGQNGSQANFIYSALSLAAEGRKAVEKNTTASANAKAVLLANVNLLEGMLYGDWAKFYESCYEFGTGKKMTPTETRDLAIARLTEAIKLFGSVTGGYTPADSAQIRGLFINPTMATKFCNSFAGMLLFDMGQKAQAAPYLTKGYARSDVGIELGYKNSNSLTTGGDAIYSAVVSGVQFQLNQYSANFRNNRFVVDTFRRFPSNWFLPQISLADNAGKINYFYPSAPGSGAGTGVAAIPADSRLAFYPIITANEVSLMLADPAVSPTMTAAERITVLTAVLTSWRIPAAVAATVAADPATTLERVARYEYAGRGRRWSAVGTYARWPLANEFNFR